MPTINPNDAMLAIAAIEREKMAYVAEMTKSVRSDEWIEEFGFIADNQDDETRNLIMDGSVEICPVCGELSAYAYCDTTDDDDALKPETGTIAQIPTSSCFEWTCGHCDRSFADSDSPILHPCYTHSED